MEWASFQEREEMANERARRETALLEPLCAWRKKTPPGSAKNAVGIP
jgi:hypothetical protein